jgi:hypothetical protein
MTRNTFGDTTRMGTVVCLSAVLLASGPAVADVLSPVPAAGDISQGLIAYYPFDGTASDATGNGHDGTIVGAVPTSGHLGLPGGGMLFNGNDYVAVPDHSGLTFGGGGFTIAAWAKFASYGGDGGYYLMGHSTGGGNRNKWIFWLGNGGLTFIYYPQSGSHWTGLGSYPFQLDTWYHVAVRGNAGALEGFVDGNSIGSASFTGTLADPANVFTIGSCELGTKPRRYFNGAMDEVRLYGRPLSDDEINQLVPEPATLSLLILGGVAILRRRRS